MIVELCFSTNQNLLIMVTTKESTPKKQRPPSPYGTTVELLCTNPGMSKDELIKKLKARKIDTEAGKSAITTGIAQTKKVVRLLRENGF